MNPLKYRLPASTGISLLLHGLVLLALQLYLQQHKPPPLRVAEPIQARLVILPPHKPKPRPDQKLLTTPAPSQFKIAQTLENPAPVVPSPPAAEVNAPVQPEHIAGIALPGAVPSPFSLPGVRVEGGAFFAERHAQQQAMRQYQQRMLLDTERQKREQEADFNLKQLHEILQRLAGSHPQMTGHCTLAGTLSTLKLQCSSATLFGVITPFQQQIALLLNATQRTSKQANGFAILHNNGNPMIIINNFQSHPNGEIDTPAAN